MNSSKFFFEGNLYQEKYIQTIAEAQESILLQCYIFKVDSFGKRVLEALLNAANRGVVVKVLVDALGSNDFPVTSIKQIEKAENIELVFFNKFKTKFFSEVGRRLHHKILIVDKKTSIIGGINIIHFAPTSKDLIPRLDFALELKNYDLENLYYYCKHIHKKTRQGKTHFKHTHVKSALDKNVKVLVNDWFLGKNEIQRSYIRRIKEAKKSILLVHGYFFPSLKIINLLKSRSRMGINITILLPKHSDWSSWIWATTHLYKQLTRANVKVMTWDKSTLHGKLGIFDKEILTLGSHNLNYTSSFGNLEMNVEIMEKPMVRTIDEDILNTLELGATKYYLQDSPINIFQSIRNFIFYCILSFFEMLTIKTLGFAKRSKK